EMPVQESLDAIAALEDDRLNVGHIIMNMVRADLLSPVTSRALESPTAPAELASTLDANGRDGSVAPQLWQAGHAHAQRRAAQRGGGRRRGGGGGGGGRVYGRAERRWQAQCR